MPKVNLILVITRKTHLDYCPVTAARVVDGDPANKLCRNVILLEVLAEDEVYTMLTSHSIPSPLIGTRKRQQ
jgi:hypothetical protein